MILTALGIAAGALIPSVSDNCVVHCVYITITLYQLSESITTSANISLFTTSRDSQGARNAWDDAQNTVNRIMQFI